MPTKNEINAAHEIGHYLVARSRGLVVTRVSILQGEGIRPSNTFDPRIAVPNDLMFEILLAGWAAEAYLKSHRNRAGEFAAGSFTRRATSSGLGAGWPCSILSRDGTDIGRIRRIGYGFWRVFYPVAALSKLGTELHNQRRRFLRMWYALTREFTLTGERLDELYDGRPSTTSGTSGSRFSPVELAASDELFPK